MADAPDAPPQPPRVDPLDVIESAFERRLSILDEGALMPCSAESLLSLALPLMLETLRAQRDQIDALEGELAALRSAVFPLG